MRVRGAVLAVLLAGCAAAAAQAAAPTAVPQTVAFWNAHDRLIGSGSCLASTCAGAISLTHDGGRTSRVVLHTSRAVDWVTVAADGHAWATDAAELERSDDGGRTWRSVGGGASRPSFADALRGLAITPPCNTSGCPQSHFVQTTDGGLTWHRLPQACPRGAGATAASAVSSRAALLLCDGQPGSGNQGKALYRSDDGWRTWHVLADVPILGMPKLGVGSHGLSGYGYAAGLSVLPSGAGVLWQERGAPIYVTLDGGRNWRRVGGFRPDDDFGMSAAVTANRVAVLLQRPAAVYRLVTSPSVRGPWRAVRYWRAG